MGRTSRRNHNVGFDLNWFKLADICGVIGNDLRSVSEIISVACMSIRCL
jgi:hypothetical protein